MWDAGRFDTNNYPKDLGYIIPEPKQPENPQNQNILLVGREESCAKYPELSEIYGDLPYPLEQQIDFIVSANARMSGWLENVYDNARLIENHLDVLERYLQELKSALPASPYQEVLQSIYEQESELLAGYQGIFAQIRGAGDNQGERIVTVDASPHPRVPVIMQTFPEAYPEVVQAIDKVRLNIPASENPRDIIQAFSRGYPGIITEPEYIDGDWSFMVHGQRFFYAEGRMLPAELRDEWQKYEPWNFYSYYQELPQWRGPTEAEIEAMKEASRHPSMGSAFLYDAIYSCATYEETEAAQMVIEGVNTEQGPARVHKYIQGRIKKIKNQIMELANQDREVKDWLNSLRNVVGAYARRHIAGTGARSLHSYGLAIDLVVPRAEQYWFKAGPQWYDVPYSKRGNPPEAIIKIFESHGFVWGGKWDIFDTMHFEYRPEILILNGIIPDPEKSKWWNWQD
ncbi:hypothetical protein NO2_0741 [Candidatus Termititenax persephonae]|uniref:Peptidase M15C domain-containing protein n=1 Tax=Candidatus Termititenax persephonae TaxID=2218525 RepID=A0A388THG4_9BACT|nr:hypothetical protein NO2_0741 [Candidatus Termititenax persephonae]